MVDLNKYKNSFFPGVIESTEVVTLKDYLGDNLELFKEGAKKFPDRIKTREQRMKFMDERVEQPVLVVKFSSTIEGKKTTNTDFLNLPSVTGFGKSKLSAFRDNNNLDWDTEKWKEAPIKLFIVNGFLKLFPESK